MEKERIEEIIREIEEKRDKREVEEYRKALKEEKERVDRLLDERQSVHVNLISVEEMKAHTKEMRAEMDRKFVGCLMIAGLTKLEALTQVSVWSAQWDSEKHGK